MAQHLNVDFKIRLPQDLKEKIRKSAESHNRTMTADIVARLEQTFNSEQDLMSALQEIKQEIQSLKKPLD